MGWGGGGYKSHRLGAVNKGRWEGGGNDKRGPLETVPGDWRPAMHRQGGRGGGAGETIKRRRERQRKQHSERQPSPIPKAYRSLLQFATESDFQPHSLLLTGAEPVFGFWSVFFLSFSCFVSRVCMGSRRARSWRTDVQGVNMKMAVLMFRLDHVRGYGWLCFGLPIVEFSQSVLVCSLKSLQLPYTLNSAACVEPAAEASS